MTGSERVEREQAERGWAINDNKIVIVAHLLEKFAQNVLASGFVYELHFRARKVERGSYHVQIFLDSKRL